MLKNTQPSLIISALLLGACSSAGNLDNLIPDRRPDYRSSHLENALEVPPDLSSANVSSRYNIPDFNPGSAASYNAYHDARVQHDQRGFIKVLPPLNGVALIEAPGQLPHLIVAAAPDTVWPLVKRYWNQQGIRLAKADPAVGIMETDWLLNKADLPSTGVSGLLDSVLGFVSDTSERDRYRVVFSRDSAGRTVLTLLYSQSVEKKRHEQALTGGESGYEWTLSDTDNPELQREMTRRLALYLSNQFAQRPTAQDAGQGGNGQFAQLGRSKDGMIVLALNAAYAQAWRALGNALDNASYAIEQADYAQGAYQVQYRPQSAEQSGEPGLWDKLVGNDKKPVQSSAPHYLVRLADQGKYSVAVVQNSDGSPASPQAARTLLENVYAHF